MMTRSRRFSVATLLLCGLAMAAIPAPAAAQYFGRNKVQYENFKFKVLTTPHFDIYYYPAEKAAATEVGRMAERWYARLSRLFNHQLSGRQPIILYASHPDFEQTNVVEGVLGEGTGGVTEGARRRVVLPMAATLADTDHVLGHELVHAFQYDILGTEHRRPAAVVHRGHGGVPVARAARRADGDVAARRGDREPAADDQEPRRSALLPVSLRPRVLGLHRRPLRRRSRRPDPRRAGAVRRRGGAADDRGSRSRSSRRRPARARRRSPPSGTRDLQDLRRPARARRRRRSRRTRC